LNENQNLFEYRLNVSLTNNYIRLGNFVICFLTLEDGILLIILFLK
jgi:hypothetical protein